MTDTPPEPDPTEPDAPSAAGVADGAVIESRTTDGEVIKERVVYERDSDGALTGAWYKEAVDG